MYRGCARLSNMGKKGGIEKQSNLARKLSVVENKIKTLLVRLSQKKIRSYIICLKIKPSIQKT